MLVEEQHLLCRDQPRSQIVDGGEGITRGARVNVGNANTGDLVAENSWRVFIEPGVSFRAAGHHHLASFPRRWSNIPARHAWLYKGALLPQRMGGVKAALLTASGTKEMGLLP